METAYRGSLQIVVNNEVVHSVEAIGYSDNKKNIGDTYKSARTDALSKAGSYFGIGNEMYKGNIAVGKKSTTVKKKVEKVVTEDKPKKFRREKKVSHDI